MDEWICLLFLGIHSIQDTGVLSENALDKTTTIPLIVWIFGLWAKIIFAIFSNNFVIVSILLQLSRTTVVLHSGLARVLDVTTTVPLMVLSTCSLAAVHTPCLRMEEDQSRWRWYDATGWWHAQRWVWNGLKQYEMVRCYRMFLSAERWVWKGFE